MLLIIEYFSAKKWDLTPMEHFHRLLALLIPWDRRMNTFYQSQRTLGLRIKLEERYLGRPYHFVR